MDSVACFYLDLSLHGLSGVFLPGSQSAWTQWRVFTWISVYMNSVAGFYLDLSLHGLSGVFLPGSQSAWTQWRAFTWISVCMDSVAGCSFLLLRDADCLTTFVLNIIATVTTMDISMAHDSWPNLRHNAP